MGASKVVVGRTVVREISVALDGVLEGFNGSRMSSEYSVEKSERSSLRYLRRVLHTRRSHTVIPSRSPETFTCKYLSCYFCAYCIVVNPSAWNPLAVEPISLKRREGSDRKGPAASNLDFSGSAARVLVCPFRRRARSGSLLRAVEALSTSRFPVG